MRERLSGVDAAWLAMDEPANTADVVAVLSFAERVPLAALRDLVRRRLLPLPRFRQRVVREGPLGRPAWEDDPGFALEHHVRAATLGPGEGAGPDGLRAFTSRVASAPLDPARPLWRMWLVEGGAGAPAGSAVVAKLHHCLGDGFALVSVLLSLADAPPALHRGRHRVPAYRDLALARPGWAALRAAAADPARALALAGEAAACALALGRIVALPADPPTSLRRPLAGERRVAWSAPFPLARVRAAARAREATVNELLFAALARALGDVLAEGEPAAPRRDVRALVPVNLRPVGGEVPLGNAFGLVFLRLPASAAAPEAALAALRASAAAAKRSPEALVTFGVLSAMGRGPRAVQHALDAFFTSKASLVVTSVPGPRRPLRLCGRPLREVMFWVPHPARLGLGVSILSYAGAVRIGARADVAVLDDPARLVARFEATLGAFTREAPERPSGSARPPRPALSPPRGEGDAVTA